MIKRGFAVARTQKRLEYIPGQMIVQIKEDAVRPAIPTGRLSFSSATARSVPRAVRQRLTYLRDNYGLSVVTPLFSTSAPRLARSRVTKTERQSLAFVSSVADSLSEELRGFAVMAMDPKKKIGAKMMKDLSASPTMNLVEPMPARWMAASRPDPMLNLQWGLRAIKWFRANRPRSGRIKVAVMDTGIDRTHPDLRGVALDYHYSGLSAKDLLGHGTHVSGIIAALTNNNIGVAGVATSKLIMWKIFRDKPEFGGFYVDGERYLRGLREVVTSGARVLNLSIGGGADSKIEALLFRQLAAHNVVVVAAMGNEFQEGNQTSYPAAYKSVIAVGALAENRRRSWFSNTGRHIDLVAPGSSILSTTPRSRSRWLAEEETDYVAWDGTSMATPHVAGAAALLLARNRHMTTEQVRQRLRKTAATLPNMRGKNWTPSYGAGLLNVQKALR